MIDKLAVQLRAMELATATGLFTWKIGNIKRLSDGAKAAPNVSIYSPYFFSHPQGRDCAIILDHSAQTVN